MLRDLRHAVRVLLHAKAWTAVVLLSLALGVGANTAIFSAVNGLLLNELPVAEPDALVRLRWGGRNDMVSSSSDYGYSAPWADGQRVRATFSFPMYRQFVADNRTMIDLFASAPIGRLNVIADGNADLATAIITTGNYYQVLGVHARLGRTLVPDDDRPDAPPAAVISSKYWHARFMSDPGVLGKTVRVNNVPVTIVGVLPADFTGVQRPGAEPHDLGLPLSLDAQLNPGFTTPRANDQMYWWLQVMGRLKPGATAEQVKGNLGGVFQQTARAGLDAYLQSATPEQRASSDNRNRTHVPQLLVDSGRRGVYDPNTRDVRAAQILGGVVTLLLLIVCANVANLLLSRATAREKEISVRLSLGATRARLVRQLLTESLVLAALGAVSGLALAYWGKQLLPGPPGQQPLLDWRVMAYVTSVTVLTGLVFGIAPALRATSGSVSTALKQSGRSLTGSRSVLGKALLVVQVAISLVLLVGAGLFLRTLSNLRQVDAGFNPHNLLLFRIAPQLNGYDEPRTLALYENLFERIGAVPGVRSVALTNVVLLSGSVNSTSIFVQGRDYPNARDNRESINRLVVSPNFFETMEISMVAGRGFGASDTDTSPKVVVINETAARKYFPGQNPIGMRFGSSPERSGQQEIVGILRDARYDSLRDAVPPTMYVPARQSVPRGAVIVVRTAVPPASLTGAVRAAVKQADPNLPLMDVSTQLETIDRLLQQERTFAAAYALFGALALLLAAIGLFGLMSYSVSRRTSEIGIRMALGAQRGAVMWQVLRESMVLVVVGIAAGVGISLWAARLVASQLFGLPPTDPATLALAAGVMLLVSAPAGFLPARRASGVDPMVALRYD